DACVGKIETSGDLFHRVQYRLYKTVRHHGKDCAVFLALRLQFRAERTHKVAVKIVFQRHGHAPAVQNGSAADSHGFQTPENLLQMFGAVQDKYDQFHADTPRFGLSIPQTRVAEKSRNCTYAQGM